MEQEVMESWGTVGDGLEEKKAGRRDYWNVKWKGFNMDGWRWTNKGKAGWEEFYRKWKRKGFSMDGWRRTRLERLVKREDEEILLGGLEEDWRRADGGLESALRRAGA
jgi:hypothetical protein